MYEKMQWKFVAVAKLSVASLSAHFAMYLLPVFLHL